MTSAVWARVTKNCTSSSGEVGVFSTFACLSRCDGVSRSPHMRHWVGSRVLPPPVRVSKYLNRVPTRMLASVTCRRRLKKSSCRALLMIALVSPHSMKSVQEMDPLLARSRKHWRSSHSCRYERRSFTSALLNGILGIFAMTWGGITRRKPLSNLAWVRMM